MGIGKKKLRSGSLEILKTP